VANKNDKNNKTLHKHTEEAIEQYFDSLNGDRPGDLYDLVMGEVERPLFNVYGAAGAHQRFR
jgi:Fis family transcriptional regulator